MNDLSHHISKLNDDNYSSWSIRIKSYATMKNLDTALTDGNFATKPENKQADDKCRALIVLNVDDRNLSQIDECSTAYEMWKILENAHAKIDNFHAILLKEFVNSEKKTTESIDEYVYRKCEIQKKLNERGLKFDEKIKIGIILIGLPETYEQTIRTIDLSKEDLTLDQIKTKLREEEKLIKNKNSSNEHATINIAKRNNEAKTEPRERESQQKNWRNERTQERTYGEENSRCETSYQSESIKCFRCNRYGHIGRFCPRYGDDTNGNRNKIEAQGQKNKKENSRITVCQTNYVANEKKEEWIVRQRIHRSHFKRQEEIHKNEDGESKHKMRGRRNIKRRRHRRRKRNIGPESRKTRDNLKRCALCS
ncbi:uncharacterized protein LOC116164016 [Photinus pyralis]|uniref:uncharacterized protein LOC116164016 n=1 Tax=Photinus pyralis TaxID=7054 RepID=UPI00126757ED|nr:uncharacterized protein LOC116164016 [Photinus pyralis]